MGKKTDEQIIEEARALYIKGQLEGNSLQLMKIAHKGNPEACYLISQIHLELANKRTKEKEREIYTKSAKIFLEKAVAAGHKEAIALMENRFGSSNGEAKVDTQISNTPANIGSISKRDAILENIATLDGPYKLESIKSDQKGIVEKFIRNHKLGISLSDVIAYRDTTMFNSGKKGHLLTEEFLYFSANGKRGTKVELSGLVSVEKLSYSKFQVIYTNGERKAYNSSEYPVGTDYYVNLFNVLVALENNTEEKTESKEQVPVDIEEAVMLMNAGQPEEAISILEKYAREGNLTAVYYLACATAETGKYSTALKYANLVKDGNADDELKQNANELIEEIQAKIEQEKKEKAEAEAREKAEAEEQARAKAEELKHLEEENAKAEAAARAKAEEIKRLEEENAKAEAAARAKAEELKHLEEENAKAEVAARAKAEELKRLEEEKTIAEAAIAELEKTAPDSTEKVLEDIHDLENEIEDAFAEMFAKLEATEPAAEEKSDEPEEESLEGAESVAESLEDDEDDIAMMCIEAAMTLYEEGKIDDAIEIWREFAEKGHLLAIYYLIIALDEKEEYGEALDWARDMWNICPDEELSQVAEEFIEKFEGDINNLFEQGLNLYRAGNYEEALKWFKSAAEQGAVEAQYNLAIMFYNGEGIPEDKQEAFKWFKSAAEQGFASAQYNLAVMYDKGKGIPEDKQEAIKWYKSAAEQGLAEAQYNLANMYYYGEGTEKNLREAFMWYKSAAVQDLEVAQYKLAEMYYKGEGTEKNLREAVKFYGVSAEQGIAEAQYNLAIMYYTGEGIAADKEEGIKWFKKAAEQGHAEAQFVLDEIL